MLFYASCRELSQDSIENSLITNVEHSSTIEVNLRHLIKLDAALLNETLE